MSDESNVRALGVAPKLSEDQKSQRSVVALLEDYLARAKAGEFEAVAVFTRLTGSPAPGLFTYNETWGPKSVAEEIGMLEIAKDLLLTRAVR